MITAQWSIRVFVHTRPTDMHKPFNGLRALVIQAMGHDVMTGD
ncbi:MAG: transposase family protein [Pirellulaceae bacterium]